MPDSETGGKSVTPLPLTVRSVTLRSSAVREHSPVTAAAVRHTVGMLGVPQGV